MASTRFRAGLWVPPRRDGSLSVGMLSWRIGMASANWARLLPNPRQPRALVLRRRRLEFRVPHSRRLYLKREPMLASRIESLPLARALRDGGREDRPHARVTPARAGSTAATAVRTLLNPVHFRARALPAPRLRGLAHRRVTPARAGSPGSCGAVRPGRSGHSRSRGLQLHLDSGDLAPVSYPFVRALQRGGHRPGQEVWVTPARRRRYRNVGRVVPPDGASLPLARALLSAGVTGMAGGRVTPAHAGSTPTSK